MEPLIGQFLDAFPSPKYGSGMWIVGEADRKDRKAAVSFHFSQGGIKVFTLKGWALQAEKKMDTMETISDEDRAEAQKRTFQIPDPGQCCNTMKDWNFSISSAVTNKRVLGTPHEVGSPELILLRETAGLTSATIPWCFSPWRFILFPPPFFSVKGIFYLLLVILVKSS